VIKVATLSCRQDRWNFLDQFDPKTTTWVIADIEQKRIIQDRLLAKHHWLAEDSCLRATELWQKLLRTSGLDRRVISPMLMQVYAERWLERSQGVRGLLSSIDTFLPILATPESVELMGEWLPQNPNSVLRWGRWFSLACDFWQKLDQDRLCLARWIPSLLFSATSEISWGRNLVVDLGPELTSLEVELLGRLSQAIGVTVLAPEAKWMHKYSRALRPYSRIVQVPNSDSETSDPRPRVRVATQLSEIKYAVEQVRSWLNQDLPPAALSIYASDPELHWPVLSPYLETEGVPVSKGRVVLAHTFPAISVWLSRLRLAIDPSSSEDHEQNLFATALPKKFDYVKFRSLLSNIYDTEDLDRYFKDLKPSESLQLQAIFGRDPFVHFALSKWDYSEDTVALQAVMNLLMVEVPLRLEMSVLDWVRYLEALAGRTEIRVGEPDPNGILIRSIASGYISEDKAAVFLSLSKEALEETDALNLSAFEVDRLEKDLGLVINQKSNERLTFVVDWLASELGQSSRLVFSETDFFGQAQSPAALWVKPVGQGLADIQNVSRFQTRWDYLQESLNLETLNPLQALRIQQDTGRAKLDPISQITNLRLSPSQIENYAECPFRFCAEKIFKLASIEEADLDVDRRSRGKLLHRVLELALERDPRSQKLTHDQLRALVDEARFSSGTTVDRVIWPALREDCVALLERFFAFEKTWRQQFPNTQTVGREVPFEGELYGFRIRGKIDRIDTNAQGEYVVIDYKSSGADLRNFASWKERDDYQLYLYMKAIESGWTHLTQGPVIGAFYFDIRKLERAKGLGLVGPGISQDLFPKPDGRGAGLDSSRLEEFKSSMNSGLVAVVEGIRQGEFAPRPKDPRKSCESCDWRSLCRAPHLNI